MATVWDSTSDAWDSMIAVWDSLPAATAYVQGAANAGSGTAQSSKTVAFAANVTAGNLLVVTVSWFGGTATVGVTDSQGNTYSSVPLTLSAAGALQVFWATASSSAADTVTVTLGSAMTFFDAEVAEYSSLVAPPYASASAAGVSASDSSGNLTINYNPTWLLGCGRCDLSGGLTGPGSGFTARASSSNDGTSGLEDEALSPSTPASQAAAFAMANGSGTWIVYGLAFKTPASALVVALAGGAATYYPTLLKPMNAGAYESQHASNISANGNYCQIGGGGTLRNPNCVMAISYMAVTGSGVSAGALALQVLGDDGTWRSVATQPVASALAASTTYSPAQTLLIGPVQGVRWNVSGLTGGNITYLELTATLQ